VLSNALLVGLMTLAAASGLAVLRVAQPDRRARVPRGLLPACSITLAASVAAVFAVAVHDDVAPTAHATPTISRRASLAEVLNLVSASTTINHVPRDLVPPLSHVSDSSNFGAPPGQCWPGVNSSTVPACAFGDTTSTRTMVLYGDSHAAMWFDALDDDARSAHWKLDVISKGSCPAVDLSVHAPLARGEWAACDEWHRFARARIAQDRPQLVVVSQALTYGAPDGTLFSTVAWQRAMATLLQALPGRKVVIGDIPFGGNLDCLLAHPTALQRCSRAAPPAIDQAEQRAARTAGATFVDTTPWFCAARCSVVIGNYSPYYLAEHVAVGYSEFLEGVLSKAIGL